MGVEDIPFDRTWEDYPTLPPISSSVILTEAPYTGMTQHTRYFQNVVGHVYGHNDMTKKACPGSDFPWHEIMEYWEREEEEVEFIEWTRSLTKLGSTDDVAEDRLAFLRDEKGYNLDEIEVIC